MSDTTAAKPMGHCSYCGGEVYEGQTHGCSTSAQRFDDHPPFVPVTPPALRAALLCDLVDWLRSEPEQGSLISTSLADYLLARGWRRAAGAAGAQPEEVMPPVQREGDVHMRGVEPAMPGARAAVASAPVAALPVDLIERLERDYRRPEAPYVILREWATSLAAERARSAAGRAEAARLAEFAAHKRGCGHASATSACTCGLAAALAAHQETSR